jgi:Uma2 family endonuclease
MVGESDEHGQITTNLQGRLFMQLLGSDCTVRHENTKVRSGPEPKSKDRPEGFYSYPDLLVVCGQRQFHDEYRDVLLNPLVIIEVLSKRTESFDRGEKFIRYRTWLPSLTDYILIAQDKPVIEHYRRQANIEWVLTTARGLHAYLTIQSIGCTLQLREVYDGVVFPAETLLSFAEEDPSTS